MKTWTWRFYGRTSQEIHEWTNKLKTFFPLVKLDTLIVAESLPDASGKTFAGYDAVFGCGDNDVMTEAVPLHPMALSMYEQFHDPLDVQGKKKKKKYGVTGEIANTEGLSGPTKGQKKHEWYQELIKSVGPEVAGKFAASYEHEKLQLLLGVLGGKGGVNQFLMNAKLKKPPKA